MLENWRNIDHLIYIMDIYIYIFKMNSEKVNLWYYLYMDLAKILNNIKT